MMNEEKERGRGVGGVREVEKGKMRGRHKYGGGERDKERGREIVRGLEGRERERERWGKREEGRR